MNYTPPCTRCYTIAFTIRSGSNLLCDMLAKNGLGHPSEYFQTPFDPSGAGAWTLDNGPAIDFKTYIDQLIAARSQRGIFGSKVAWDHKNALLDNLAQSFGPSIAGLEDFFPHHTWIYVRRRDRFAQAVSAWTAQETGAWSSDMKRSGALPAYDFFAIFTMFFSLLVEDHMWETYFGQMARPPLRLWYEDFVDSPAGTIGRVVRILHERWQMEPPLAETLVFGSRLKKQADERSAEYAARFSQDLHRIGAGPHWRSREKQLANWLQFFRDRGWNQGTALDAPEAIQAGAEQSLAARRVAG